MSWLDTPLEVLGIVAIAYFALLNGIYLAFTAIAWRTLGKHLHRRRYAGLDELFASPLTPASRCCCPPTTSRRGSSRACAR